MDFEIQRWYGNYRYNEIIDSQKSVKCRLCGERQFTLESSHSIFPQSETQMQLEDPARVGATRYSWPNGPRRPWLPQLNCKPTTSLTLNWVLKAMRNNLVICHVINNNSYFRYLQEWSYFCDNSYLSRIII